MQKFFVYFLAFIASLYVSCVQIFAAMPFQDISPSDPYYNAVSELFDADVLRDDGSHLFRPNEIMNRDFYVALASMIGCKECMAPSQDDIVKYSSSPFIDLPKTNVYYYCIAYAKDQGITRGYIMNASGNTSCQDGTIYQSSPFCANNSITRIEAAAVLLRRANLWDDSLNMASRTRTEIITDVSDYWYGYAKKGIQIGILQKKSDNTIGSEEPITRGEFALMASKILGYTQCNFSENTNSVASYIQVFDENTLLTTKTAFTQGQNFSLKPQTEPGNWKYKWTATDSNGTQVTGDGLTFSGNILQAGKWYISVEIIDTLSNKTISHPSVTIDVLPSASSVGPSNDDTDGDGIKNTDDTCPTVPGIASNKGCSTTTGSDNISTISDTALGVVLTASPSVTYIGNPITFTPSITSTHNDLIYRWDFGDGNTSSGNGIQKHTYDRGGVYKTTLTVTDPKNGFTAQSRVIVRISEDRDTDGDGVLDSLDSCPQVRGPATNKGCPIITVPDYGCVIRDVYAGEYSCPITSDDTDGDGIKNTDDACPTVPGIASNKGCPSGSGSTTTSDTDGDGIADSSDMCPSIRGIPQWNGCPYPNLYGGILKNICLLDKLDTTGLITASPVCTMCPCSNSIEITSTIRDCDILFPTILSEDKNMIFSRGNFYLLRSGK